MRRVVLTLAVLLVMGCGAPLAAVPTALPTPVPSPTPDEQQRLLNALAPRCSEPRAALLRDADSTATGLAATGATMTTAGALAAAGYVLDHAPRLLHAPDGLINCQVVFTFVAATGTPEGATKLADVVNAR